MSLFTEKKRTGSSGESRAVRRAHLLPGAVLAPGDARGVLRRDHEDLRLHRCFGRERAAELEHPKVHPCPWPAEVARRRADVARDRHLATFTFAPVSPSKTHLTVSDPDSTPFFQALIRDGARLSPSIPVRTSWLETRLARCICKGRAFEFLQLPLPALEGFELEGQPVQDALKVKPSATSWATVSTLTSVERDEWIGFGDGVGFPRFGVYTGLGARIDFTGAGMSFPLPDVGHAAAE